LVPKAVTARTLKLEWCVGTCRGQMVIQVHIRAWKCQYFHSF
jgi:hypothetical protein